MILARNERLCNFLEYREGTLVYRRYYYIFLNFIHILNRYASLYFLFHIDKKDNELMTLETIQHFVEILDQYFGNVCELDVIYNFDKVYYIVDELFISGRLMESSKREILSVCDEQDKVYEEEQQNQVVGKMKSTIKDIKEVLA